MTIKDSLKKEWPVLILLLAPFISSFILWDKVPDTVPTHFNFQGEADDYGPKWVILLFFPGIAAATYFLLLIAPLIDPKKRIENAQKPVSAIRIVTSIFLVGIYTVIMLIALGKDIEISTYTTLGVGFLFLVLGNYMNSVKPNYFIGLKTPWTLEHPWIWKKTHRMGSKLWMLGGIVVILSPLIPGRELFGMDIIFLVIVPLAAIPFIYSYYLFTKNEKEEVE